MQALELLGRYADVDGKTRFYDADETVSIDGVVPKALRDAVVDERGRVERIPYELCVCWSTRERDSARSPVAGTDIARYRKRGSRA